MTSGIMGGVDSGTANLALNFGDLAAATGVGSADILAVEKTGVNVVRYTLADV